MKCRCRFKSTVAIRHGACVVASFTRPRFHRHRTRRLGWSQTDDLDRLPQGGLLRFVSTIRKFIRDVVRLTISRGQLSAIIGKVTGELERPDEELLDCLPDEERVNVDETGHKQNRQRMWTWRFCAELYTLFKIDPTRKTEVFIKGWARSSTESWAATTFRRIGATWIGST